MSLHAKIDAYKKAMMKKVPPETLAVMHRATEDLKQSGIMDRVVKVGDRAPGFELEDTQKQRVNLQDRLESGPLVVTFYRGKW